MDQGTELMPCRQRSRGRAQLHQIPTFGTQRVFLKPVLGVGFGGRDLFGRKAPAQLGSETRSRSRAGELNMLGEYRPKVSGSVIAFEAIRAHVQNCQIGQAECIPLLSRLRKPLDCLLQILGYALAPLIEAAK